MYGAVHTYQYTYISTNTNVLDRRQKGRIAIDILKIICYCTYVCTYVWCTCICNNTNTTYNNNNNNNNINNNIYIHVSMNHAISLLSHCNKPLVSLWIGSPSWFNIAFEYDKGF